MLLTLADLAPGNLTIRRSLRLTKRKRVLP